jgi:hypothetical protein
MDLNRVYWRFRNLQLQKDTATGVGGSFKLKTHGKPIAKPIGKIPEFFPVRLTVRLTFQARRRIARAFLFPESVVLMPSFLFLLDRKWKANERGEGGMRSDH